MDDHIVIQPHKSQQNKDLLQALRLIGCSELHLRDRADHSNSHWWIPMFIVGKTMPIYRLGNGSHIGPEDVLNFLKFSGTFFFPCAFRT